MSPEWSTMSAKLKNFVLSLEKKVWIINRAVDHNESIKKLDDEFNVDEKAVHA